MACGMCLVSQYLEELPDGKVRPRGTGILTDRDQSTFVKVMDNCPVKAISLESVIVKNKAEVIASAEQKIASFCLSAPTRKELSYEKKYAEFLVPVCVAGEGVPDYSSYNSAKSAAMRAIDQAMFSQRGAIVRNIVTNYSMDKLTPYTRYDETEKNFFFTANKKAEKLLAEIAGEFEMVNTQKKIPESLLKIQSRPDLRRDYEIKSLKEDILYLSDAIINEEMKGEYYELSYYVQDCDIDSMEMYEGTGLFGREKYVDKYYFSKTRLAFEEIAKDIRSACESSFNDIIVDGFSLGMIKSIAAKYEKRLKEELKNKLRMLISNQQMTEMSGAVGEKKATSAEKANYPEWKKRIEKLKIEREKEREREQKARYKSIQKLTRTLAAIMIDQEARLLEGYILELKVIDTFLLYQNNIPILSTFSDEYFASNGQFDEHHHSAIQAVALQIQNKDNTDEKLLIFIDRLKKALDNKSYFLSAHKKVGRIEEVVRQCERTYRQFNGKLYYLTNEMPAPLWNGIDEKMLQEKDRAGIYELLGTGIGEQRQLISVREIKKAVSLKEIYLMEIKEIDDEKMSIIVGGRNNDFTRVQKHLVVISMKSERIKYCQDFDYIASKDKFLEYLR